MEELFDRTIGSRCIKLINNGLEIVAKEKSCSGRKDGVSLFLDSSVGCDLGCLYCWLTRNKTNFRDAEDNVWIALLNEMVKKIKATNWTIDRNVFVKFMGQGDPFLNPLQTLDRLNSLEKICYEGDIVIGGISYSSIFPQTSKLEDIVRLFNGSDTIVFPRVYVSVGSFISEHRHKIFPQCRSLKQSLEFCSSENVELRLHWTPLNIIKDINKELDICLDTIRKYNIKSTRIIPYNPISKADKLQQYDNINYLVDVINTHGYACDVLQSSGHSIDASCGMFSSKRKQ